MNIVNTPHPLGTTADAARALGITPARVRQLCLAGRVVGAQRVGRDWAIPMPPVVLPVPTTQGPLPHAQQRQRYALIRTTPDADGRGWSNRVVEVLSATRLRRWLRQANYTPAQVAAAFTRLAAGEAVSWTSDPAYGYGEAWVALPPGADVQPGDPWD